MSEPYLAISVVMMPRDANPNANVVAVAGGAYPVYSTIFGGVILSHIDLAGAVGARREIQLRGETLKLPPQISITHQQQMRRGKGISQPQKGADQ